MNKQEKELLLKALCEGLLHGIKCKWVTKDTDLLGIMGDIAEVGYDTNDYDVAAVEDIKPYLRPMSSMTEEELKELKEETGLIYDYENGLDLAEFQNNYKCLDFYLSEAPSYVVVLVFDWLNKHHFDYRGLISMGLALEAPEGMYKID